MFKLHWECNHIMLKNYCCFVQSHRFHSDICKYHYIQYIKNVPVRVLLFVSLVAQMVEHLAWIGRLGVQIPLGHVTVSVSKTVSSIIHLCVENGSCFPCTIDVSNVKSSPPSAVHMLPWTWSALVQIMACCLFGAKPLSKPKLGYC